MCLHLCHQSPLLAHLQEHSTPWPAPHRAHSRRLSHSYIKIRSAVESNSTLLLPLSPHSRHCSRGYSKCGPAPEQRPLLQSLASNPVIFDGQQRCRFLTNSNHKRGTLSGYRANVTLKWPHCLRVTAMPVSPLHKRLTYCLCSLMHCGGYQNRP